MSGHCPPLQSHPTATIRLPLKDPVIESAQHAVYVGPTSERGRPREEEERTEREAQKKKKGLFVAQCGCQTTGKQPGALIERHDVIKHGIKRSLHELTPLSGA